MIERRAKNSKAILLMGSQKLQLMEGISESLAGRISVVELDGLSLREIHGVGFNQHFVPSSEYLSSREKKLLPSIRQL